MDLDDRAMGDVSVSHTTSRREWAAVGLGAAVYFGVRVIVEGTTAEAHRNADRIAALEAALGLDVERRIQDAVVERDFLRVLGNLSYVWLHWPLLLGVLGVLLVRDPTRFRHLRDTLFVSGAVGLVLFAALPVAPPRFVTGYTGTVSDGARFHYLPVPLDWSNRYASFPSFHVGWTLVACLALAASLSSRRGIVLSLVPAVLVAAAVVTTGNHYVVDAVAGAAIALGAYLAIARRRALAPIRVDPSSPAP